MQHKPLPPPQQGVNSWLSASAMAKHDEDLPEQRTLPRPVRSVAASPLQPPAPPAGRSAAPGDEPLAIPATLTLGEPFRFDRGLAKRLRMREVNATEAFTL